MLGPDDVLVTRLPGNEYRIMYRQTADQVPISMTGSAAQTICFLTRLVFAPQAECDMRDKRVESERIMKKALADMQASPEKYLP